MVRVGLAGLGFMGGTHAQCHAALPNAKLVAVVDPEPDRRGSFAETYGATPYANLEDMLASADVDMVDICMPTYLHRKAVETVAAAGKHILCEKPMALNAKDCDAMIAATKKAGVKFMIGQVLRFWPEYVVIKDILDSGRLGRVKWASATRLSPPPTWSWNRWLYNNDLSGGAVLDLHIHDVDTLNWMLGAPKTVSAAGAQAPGGGLDNVFSIFSGYPGGQVAFAEGSFSLAPSFPFTMGLKIDCEGGTIDLNSALTPSLRLAPVEGDVEYPEVPAVEVPTVAGAGSAGNISSLGGYFVEVEYFVNCVANNTTPDRVTPEEAKVAVQSCLAAAKSAQTGAPVKV